MSAVGTSVVNKSGKKVAPKAPPRRRFTSATASAAPRFLGPQREPNNATDGEPLVPEPAAKRRRIADTQSFLQRQEASEIPQVLPSAREPSSQDVVAYETPRQAASQITWNLRTGKTTDETVGPGRAKRKSARNIEPKANKPELSARLRNRERRKQKAAARLDIEVAAIEPEKHRARASTPEGFEAVQIVPSVVTMFELSARNIRTGWKSEREKLMAQIDWDEVKQRRRAEEVALAQQQQQQQQEPRVDVSDVEGGERADNDDLDAQLSRAVAKNKTKLLRIRLVNGEHVVDEASQLVDRHALANEEDTVEVEEDDLTKKFNTQSLIRLRRKDPAERVRNWDPWTLALTDKFYECLRKFGTDFMVIAKCFPGRTRREIKAKFVREERDNPDRIHDALSGVSAESWDLEAFQSLANLASVTDPVQVYAELQRRREERQREIEEQKKETAELERQMILAGMSEEADSESPPKKKQKKREPKKKKGHPKDGGDEEEILE